MIRHFIRFSRAIPSAVFSVSLLFVSCSTVAQAATCSSFFEAGRSPLVLDNTMVRRSHLVCYSYYAVDESGLTKTPIWAAEKLTASSVDAAREMKRLNAFHEDTSVDSDEEASLRDYVHSGYDRGHNVPSGDAPDAKAQYETFSLLNMSPQNSDNNRHLWEGIESKVRDLAEQVKEVYVVTGPVFIGPATYINARVEVPTYLWKAVYVPGLGAGAYITRNAPGNDFAVVSISQLKEITHIDPFPSIAEAMASHAMDLPSPGLKSRRKANQVALADLGLTVGNASASGAGTHVWLSTLYQGKAATDARNSVKRALHNLGVNPQ